MRRLLLALAIVSGATAALAAGLSVGPAPTPNADYLADMSAKLSPQVPFYRIGEPIVIPFTPTSGNVEVPVSVPPQATSFRYAVNAPCSVRFRGRKDGAPFVALTPTTGWLWFPGSWDIHTSLQPVAVIALGVDGPFASVQPAQKACSGTVELQFGTGQS